ncbi:MAG: hypothetical protein QOE18_325, partial [Chloroflexota bacterium]|nr:hypothetical protein [Chloroflexota bacterium]
MRLLMFHNGGTRLLGVAREGAPDEIIDVAAAANGSGAANMPSDILGVIDGGAGALDRLRELASSAPPTAAVRSLANLTL